MTDREKGLNQFRCYADRGSSYRENIAISHFIDMVCLRVFLLSYGDNYLPRGCKNQRKVDNRVDDKTTFALCSAKKQSAIRDPATGLQAASPTAIPILTTYNIYYVHRDKHSQGIVQSLQCILNILKKLNWLQTTRDEALRNASFNYTIRVCKNVKIQHKSHELTAGKFANDSTSTAARNNKYLQFLLYCTCTTFVRKNSTNNL